MSYGLVDGKILYSDSTHLKASANKNKFTEHEVRKETQDYIGALNEAINEDRALHGKKPLVFGKEEIKEPVKRKTKITSMIKITVPEQEAKKKQK